MMTARPTALDGNNDERLDALLSHAKDMMRRHPEMAADASIEAHAGDVSACPLGRSMMKEFGASPTEVGAAIRAAYRELLGFSLPAPITPS